MNYTIKYSNELYHHGVKGMKWGVRNAIQTRRQNTIRSAAELAAKRARDYGQDVKYYSDGKNRKGTSTKTDLKRWASASKNAQNYFNSKQKIYSELSQSKISRKQVKQAKKWIKEYGFHTEAEYADVYQKDKTTNYLNNLSSMDKRKRI